MFPAKLDQVTSEPTEQESWMSWNCAKTGAVWPCSKCHHAAEKSPDMSGSSCKNLQESHDSLASPWRISKPIACSFPKKAHKSFCQHYQKCIATSYVSCFWVCHRHLQVPSGSYLCSIWSDCNSAAVTKLSTATSTMRCCELSWCRGRPQSHYLRIFLANPRFAAEMLKWLRLWCSLISSLRPVTNCDKALPHPMVCRQGRLDGVAQSPRCSALSLSRRVPSTGTASWNETRRSRAWNCEILISIVKVSPGKQCREMQRIPRILQETCRVRLQLSQCFSERKRSKRPVSLDLAWTVAWESVLELHCWIALNCQVGQAFFQDRRQDGSLSNPEARHHRIGVWIGVLWTET